MKRFILMLMLLVSSALLIAQSPVGVPSQGLYSLPATYNSAEPIPAGAGTATYLPSGAISKSSTALGTGANTNETDLWSYSLPANTLNVNARGIRVTFWGTTAANANTKTVKFYFGSALSVNDNTTTSGAQWRYQFEILRVAAGSQTAGRTGGINSVGVAVLASTQDETAAIVLRVTGTNGTAVANDIVFRGAIVEILP